VDYIASKTSLSWTMPSLSLEMHTHNWILLVLFFNRQHSGSSPCRPTTSLQNPTTMHRTCARLNLAQRILLKMQTSKNQLSIKQWVTTRLYGVVPQTARRHKAQFMAHWSALISVTYFLRISLLLWSVPLNNSYFTKCHPLTKTASSKCWLIPDIPS
jgi:hypothetical protein